MGEDINWPVRADIYLNQELKQTIINSFLSCLVFFFFFERSLFDYKLWQNTEGGYTFYGGSLP